MWHELRRSYATLITSGGQLFLLVVAFQFHNRTAWVACLALIALVSLAAWWSALKRARTVGDLPMSLVATAAQGYVRLQGRGKPLGGTPLLTPTTGMPCLWYRLQTEERQDHRWVNRRVDESITSFLLEDPSGTSVVDPEGAEIIATRKEVWEDNDCRYTLWTLIERDAIQVVGSLRTDSTSHVERSVSQAVGDLLADWKHDRHSLLKRFDLDGNGEIDMKEWELARAQARREVEQARRQAIADHRDLHMVGPPGDGRPYLIATLTHDDLAQRYGRWVWLQAGFFLVSLAALAWVLRHWPG